MLKGIEYKMGGFDGNAEKLEYYRTGSLGKIDFRNFYCSAGLNKKKLSRLKNISVLELISPCRSPNNISCLFEDVTL